ncbi:hypothetical protein [Salinisphaera hydrothermalis]|uniref:hypothetical protein n=1 Tax=Salinisphaera hydrothermalis TaxID=563188 RepID=UPI003340C5EE
MNALAEQPKPQHSNPIEVVITKAAVPPPLNLRLPPSTPSDGRLLTARQPLPKAQTTATPRTIVGPLSLNLNPHIDDDDALAKDSHLFNHASGLRGFMAQNWLNKSVGFQGGLAIKEAQLRAENSRFRDNVAVGMGVLLAF